ncbi:MAG: ABC transporter ATP-binding protein [Flavobacteriaceae bacterium]|nr:ABC transporter ATP-binding protein [Flavobacteriaceae bacterium]
MIQVNNLSKSFDEIQAVNDIGFTIEKGEIFGLLGPNGAGKSTTINMLSTILQSDSGTILIDDIDVKTNSKACKKLIGVVPQEISLYEDLSAYDNLLFWGKLYDIPPKKLKENINTILDLIGLSDRKKDLIKTYSGGMKRRINIAAAILHQPKVLFMDEPTVGIDPQSRNHIFEVIETLNEQGMTIIYTTHYMEEVERLCERIAIIDSGKIITQGTQTELQNLTNVKETIELEFESLSTNTAQNFKEKISHDAVQIDNKISIASNVKNLPGIITLCNELEMEIKDLTFKKANLEAIFLSLTGKQLRD